MISAPASSSLEAHVAETMPATRQAAQLAKAGVPQGGVARS